MTDLKHGKDLSEHLKQTKEKEEADKRINFCTEEINRILKDNNCALDAIMVIGRQGAIPQITIIANKSK